MTAALPVRPRVWPYLVGLPLLAATWVVALEGWIQPPEYMMASADPSRRLLWWLVPPFALLLAFFTLRSAYLSYQTDADAAQQAAAKAEVERQQDTAEGKAAAALARQRETLEVLGLGLVVEKFRNVQVWEAIDKVKEQPFASILPREAEELSGPLVRGQQSGKRGADTFEYAERYFVEKIPLPGIAIFPKPTGKDPDHWDSGAGTLMGSRQSAGLAFTLFITAEQIYADDPDEALGKIFDFFDAHPDVPAVFVYASDGYMTKKFLKDYSPDDINGDPGWKPGDPTDTNTAFVLVRRDRVDKLIRPYVVDEPYQAGRDTPTNRLKSFYFNQETEFSERTKQAGLTAAEWERIVPSFIEQLGAAHVSAMTPFWERERPKGFKPSPWIPVPWAKWQLEEFDALPTLGYLHRPQYAAYRPDGQPLPEKARAEAFAAAWKQALATLPEGQAPQRLFFDAGAAAQRGRGLVPMSRSLTEHHADQDWLGTPRAIDLSARMGDTGAASPFTQIALALIAGYREGGPSATVNLRREDGASIVMVSPPNEPPEKRKSHPGAGKDPFKVKLMPEFAQ